MNKSISIVAIVVLALSLTSGAAQVKEPNPDRDITAEMTVKCDEIASMREAAAFQKDAQLSMAVKDTTSREEMFIRIAMALGLESFIQNLDHIKCIES